MGDTSLLLSMTTSPGAAGGVHPAAEPVVEFRLPGAEAALSAAAGAASVVSQVPVIPCARFTKW